MSSSRPVTVVVVVVALFVVLFAWRGSSLDETPEPDQPPASTSTSSKPPAAVRAGYLITNDGAGLSAEPTAPGVSIAGGIILPVLEEESAGYRVLDSCNRESWVSADDVEAGLVPIERTGRMEDSVFVIDPGHGLPDLGAVGPSGLTEAEVNLDVSARIVELLRSSHDIDPETRTVIEGDSVAPVADAILTRSPDGPNGGDYELGLTFRATLGNSVEATALISIHHNTQPTQDLDHPGSSAFVSVENPDSPRLGGLIVDELRTAFARFDADWVGGQGNGLAARIGDNGDDYYSVLERSEVTAVIVEGAYISNPSEEALIMTGEFRQAYAESVYRAIVRFVTTDDDPIPAPEPERFDVDGPPRSMDDCVVPTP